MLTMTAEVSRVDAKNKRITLTNIKKYGHDLLQSQTLKSGIWSRRITNAGSLIAFNAEVKSYRMCDTDGETYHTVERTYIKPTTRAQIMRAF